MGQPHCIITGKPITQANNSKAHVIPSALGGRLKPWNILSKDGNTLLGDNIDLPLIEAFQSLMTFIDASRDRGSNRPVRLTDESSRVVVLEFGEPLKLAQTTYNEQQTAQGLEVRIEARNLKELRTHLGRVKAKVPAFDIDEAMKHAVVTRTWPDGVLHGQLQIGPAVVFPAVFVAASVFAKHHGLDPHPLLRSYVDAFDPEKPVLPPDTFFFMPDRPWFEAPGEVTHIVVLRADAATGRVLVCVELFNVMTVGVVLPYSGDVDRTESYAVNILTGSEAAVTVDLTACVGVTWTATHENGDPALQRHITGQLDRLLATAKARETRAQTEALVAKAFGTDETAPLKPDGLVILVKDLVDFTLQDWERPLTTVSDRKNGLTGFDNLCASFENLFKPGGRPIFRSKIAADRARLQAAIDQARAAEDS